MNSRNKDKIQMNIQTVIPADSIMKIIKMHIYVGMNISKKFS